MKLNRQNKLLIGLCTAAVILIVRLFCIQIIEKTFCHQQGEDLYGVYECAAEPAISFELESGSIYAVYSGDTPEFELDDDGSIYLKTLEES